MKKIIAIAAMFIPGLTNNVTAHVPTIRLSIPAASRAPFLPIYMNYEGLSVAVDGTTATAKIPDGLGSIKMLNRGDGYTQVVYIDAAGRSTNLLTVTSFKGRGTKPICKTGQSNSMYSSTDGSINMILCKAAVVADGSTPLTLSIVLPAIQTIREPATSTRN